MQAVSERTRPKPEVTVKKPRKSFGRMANERFPNPVDVHIGGIMRQRRTILGPSQFASVEAIGLTFPPVQKHERDPNRASPTPSHSTE